VYLRSLECRAVFVEIGDEDDDDHFAAHVAEGMKKAKMVLVPRDP
jgi:hypothetical protein